MAGDPPMGCWIPSPFQPSDWHPAPVFPQPFVPVAPTTTEPIPAPSLSDADVDRIARRVVEILRQPAVDPEAQALVDKVFAESMPKPTTKRRIARRK